MKKHKHSEGFLLISLVIVLAIIVILFVVMYGKSHNGESTAQTYQSDIQAAQQVKNLQNQQNSDIQSQVDSAAGTSPSIGHRAIEQAKGLQSQNAAPQQ